MFQLTRKATAVVLKEIFVERGDQMELKEPISSISMLGTNTRPLAEATAIQRHPSINGRQMESPSVQNVGGLVTSVGSAGPGHPSVLGTRKAIEVSTFPGAQEVRYAAEATPVGTQGDNQSEC